MAKKSRTKLLLITMTIFLVGCSNVSDRENIDDAEIGVIDRTEYDTKMTAEDCAAEGGVLERVGMLQSLQCVHKYSDGGKTCESSADCEGNCIVTETDGSNPTCAIDDNEFGCKSTIEDFREHGGILCVD
jgi:hypothetical protein